jgi:predicted nucleic acid-binding protein
MILVDSSVWIDYFRGVRTPQSDRLDILLGAEPVLIGDLILGEVLQGFDGERDFNRGLGALGRLTCIDIAGREIAIAAARNLRALRALGVTVRKTIDTLIATRCIEDGYDLLYSDRDFDPFVTHLGLISAMSRAQDAGGARG